MGDLFGVRDCFWNIHMFPNTNHYHHYNLDSVCQFIYPSTVLVSISNSSFPRLEPRPQFLVTHTHTHIYTCSAIFSLCILSNITDVLFINMCTIFIETFFTIMLRFILIFIPILIIIIHVKITSHSYNKLYI